MKIFNRRLFLKTSLIGGILGSFGSNASSAVITPSEIEGPFYPITPQKDIDFDLTTVKGRKGVAKGKIINIRGKILDANLKPIEDATVDIWQANAAGRYRHPHDSNPAPLDENFQGWAIVQSGSQGQFNFKTVMPGQYPASRTWIRPPHIHFKVSKVGYHELITQMYFPGNKLNKKDWLLQGKTAPEQDLMIAKKVKGSSNTIEYNIFLKEI